MFKCSINITQYLVISLSTFITNEQKQLFVLHIAKNGGTALISYLRTVQTDTEISLSGFEVGERLLKQRKNNIHTFHLEYPKMYRSPLLSPLLSQQPRLVIVRNPVDRIISEYYFLQKHHSNYITLPVSLQKKPISFKEWTSEPLQRNYQLAYLLGYNMFSHIITETDWNAWCNIMQKNYYFLIELKYMKQIIPRLLRHLFNINIPWLPRHTGRGIGVNKHNITIPRTLNEDNKYDMRLYKLALSSSLTLSNLIKPATEKMEIALKKL